MRMQIENRITSGKTNHIPFSAHETLFPPTPFLPMTKTRYRSELSSRFLKISKHIQRMIWLNDELLMYLLHCWLYNIFKQS